jgi:hypothetical protein
MLAIRRLFNPFLQAAAKPLQRNFARVMRGPKKGLTFGKEESLASETQKGEPEEEIAMNPKRRNFRARREEEDDEDLYIVPPQARKDRLENRQIPADGMETIRQIEGTQIDEGEVQDMVKKEMSKDEIKKRISKQ